MDHLDGIVLDAEHFSTPRTSRMIYGLRKRRLKLSSNVLGKYTLSFSRDTALEEQVPICSRCFNWRSEHGRV